jgi:hypothetical protein
MCRGRFKAIILFEAIDWGADMTRKTEANRRVRATMPVALASVSYLALAAANSSTLYAQPVPQAPEAGKTEAPASSPGAPAEAPPPPSTQPEGAPSSPPPAQQAPDATSNDAPCRRSPSIRRGLSRSRRCGNRVRRNRHPLSVRRDRRRERKGVPRAGPP